MGMVLELLNLDTSRKVIKAWFFFLGLSLFLNFSGVEDQFETGQLQTIKSTDLYCASGEVVAKSSSSDKAFEVALFVSSVIQSESSSSPAVLAKDFLSIHSRRVVSKVSDLNHRPLGVFDFSKPARAPPLA